MKYFLPTGRPALPQNLPLMMLLVFASALLLNLLAERPEVSPSSSHSAVPIGAIIAFAGRPEALPPEEGWLLCDGRELPIQKYDQLFAVVQYAWGQGTRSGTFRLPDLRGRFLRGVDLTPLQDRRDPERDLRLPAYPGGNSGNLHGSVQEDAIQSHSHSIVGASRASGITDGPGWLRFYETNVLEETVQDETTILSAGGAETRPKNAYVHWLIRAR